ncbi:sulfite exporter TauE/SafE family protein [Methanobacterium alcaliphilum]|uniref:sulfite exporter TauE/SafE family protein n=1 Tax=Methanobacterium alcaliphilum TaxID=392018 RepID=UPI00200A3E57|nr:sulfite exporter TauE/SafE family protein [Methanobacterium alcaliphilum]MCK9151827.1 sulfite exporter TauE/SafE family protein [Methanobacterium alcaliphilum]
MVEIIILFLIAAFLSILVGTVAGFGASTIFLPIALIFFDFKTALVLVAIAHLSGNIGASSFFRQGLDKKLILLFGIPSVLLTVLGAYVVVYFPQNILKVVLGLFLLIFSLYSLVRPEFHVKASRFNTVFGGGLSGFLQGLMGIGGPLRGFFLISYNLDKYTYIATISAIAVVIDLSRIPIYFANNLLDREFYYYIIPLIVVGVLASYVGKKMVNKIPQDAFKKVVLVAIIVASILLIYNGTLGG